MDKKASILEGKWIVRWHPEEFTYREILEYLGVVGQNAAAIPGVKVVHIDRENLTGVTEAQDIAALQVKKIDKVLLCSPFLGTDKRWQTIGVTASAVFLGSALTDRGIDVAVQKLQLPAPHIDDEMFRWDLVGFTLFEDLLPEFKNFLGKFLRENEYHGLLAAGGPLVTLNPWQAAFHLPEINLLVRGEAELILAGILKALEENNLEQLLSYRGFLFQVPGLLIVSDFQEINRPRDFSGFHFNLSFLKREHLANGLEINFSRGCSKGCLFCSKVQGKELRKLPLKRIEALLEEFSAALARVSLTGKEGQFAATLNINDDDILQDTEYTRQMLALVKRHGFNVWGIQAAPASFFAGNGRLHREAIDTIDDREAFVNQRPLVWLGSDAFLPQRAGRLGKWLPQPQAMERLIAEFEERDILNYQYWICSDQHTDWQEFVQEFLLICAWQQRFKNFSILAHSPFLVPYTSTPLHRLLSQSPNLKKQIKIKKTLGSRQEMFNFDLVERLETPFPYLNRLLNNEGSGKGESGFLDSLKQNDWFNAGLTIYNFLKQERMVAEADHDHQSSKTLKETESLLEQFLASF